MIKQVQQPGVRNWYGDDLVGIQTEGFKVLEGFFGDYGNYIVSGCQVANNGGVYNITPGIVCLSDPNDGSQLAYYPGKNNVAQWPVYIGLDKSVTNDTYEDGNNKPVQITYSTVDSPAIPTGSYVTIQQNGATTRIWDVVQTSARRFVTDALINLWNQNIVQPGMMLWWPKAAPPVGWLECDNSPVAISTYPNLYAQIGATWGGDNVNFRLPPSQGYFIRGWDHGKGIDPARAFGSIQQDDLKSHTHDVQRGDSYSGKSQDQFNYVGGGQESSPQPDTVTLATGSTETRPKNVALMLIIKY